jgi:hypothetical protein
MSRAADRAGAPQLADGEPVPVIGRYAATGDITAQPAPGSGRERRGARVACSPVSAHRRAAVAYAFWGHIANRCRKAAMASVSSP